MKLEEIYNLSLFCKSTQKCSKNIEKAGYVSDIYLQFYGTAHIKVFLGRVCVEESLASHEYYVKNFRLCPYPNNIYNNLRIECDVPYLMTYIEHEHDQFIDSVIIYNGAFYEFADDSSGCRYLIMKNSIQKISNQKEMFEDEKYEYNDEEVVISGDKLIEVVQDREFQWLKKIIFPSFGKAYTIVSDLDLYNLPKPSIIVHKSQLMPVLCSILCKFPEIKLELSKISSQELLEQNRNSVLHILRFLRNKLKKQREFNKKEGTNTPIYL
jgi:hypothetical protein